MLPGRKEEPPKTLFPKRASRRDFLATTAAATASTAWFEWPVCAAEGVSDNSGLSALPKGPTPAPVSLPHFPDRMHAFVWRNWELVPIRTLARVLGTSVNRKSTRLNSSHVEISYAVFCLKKKNTTKQQYIFRLTEMI